MTDNHELLLTLDRRTRAMQDQDNWIARGVKTLLDRHTPHMRLVASLVINTTGGFTNMSGTTTIPLTNAADPTKATRYLGVVDIANGTTLPTVTSSDPTKLAVVVGPLTNNQVTFGAYPLSTDAEADDTVTLTISLPGNPDIVETFDISGQPVPPPETDTLDASSAVGTWAGAPAVPATPV